MENIKIKITINEVRLIKVEKIGKYNILYFENGTKLKGINGNKITLHCNECNKTKTISYNKRYLNKEKWLCDSCNRKGKRNGFYGKKHKQKLKDKLSNERKGTWYVGNKNVMKNIEIKKRHAEKMNSKEIKQKISKACSGQKNGFYGKTHTKEAINKIIEKNKKYRENLTEDEKQKISNKLKEAQIRIKNKNPDEYRKNKIKAAIVSSKSQYRYKINNIEKKVMDYLIAKGVDVKYSIIMGCYQYDFKVKEEKILIECNGIYWHGHPDYYNINGSNGKRKLNDIQIKKQQKDKDKKEFAVHRGFEIITIWENEINNNNFKKLEKLWNLN